MNKIVINVCYGGFGLSAMAIDHILHQNKSDVQTYFYKDCGWDVKRRIFCKKMSPEEATIVSLKDFGEQFWTGDVNEVELKDNIIWQQDLNLTRHDPRLIKAVEELRDKANGLGSKLEIVEIDSDRYYIEEYDGWERVLTPETIPWITIK